MPLSVLIPATLLAGCSGSSSGAPEADPLSHELCGQGLPAGDQTEEALEIAEAIELEIADLGRADDIALLDFGIRQGAGQGGADIFCLSLALHVDWYASLESFCVQDVDQEVVVDEVSEAVASAPSMPALAPLADVEAVAARCLGEFTYVPCRAQFLGSTFDPNVLSFSASEDEGCSSTDRRVTLFAGSAKQLDCMSESYDTCDTEG